MTATLAGGLFRRVAPAMAATVAVIGTLAFAGAGSRINTVYDAQMISNANVLWALLQDESGDINKTTRPKGGRDDITSDTPLGITLPVSEAVDNYADDRMFRLWKGHRVMMFSENAFSAAEVPLHRSGFIDVPVHGEKWRFYALPIADQDVVIEVGEKMTLRQGLVRDILFDLFAPLPALIPFIGFTLWFGIKNGLGTVRGLVEQIRRRSPEDLSALQVDRLPHDLAPLGRSINRLLSNLERSLTAERRFADHAAHQLRTPLTGLKLQLQMLQRCDEESERAALIVGLMQSNERAVHLVEQLLHAARVRHQPIRLQPTPLYRITAEAMAQLHTDLTLNLTLSLTGDEQAEAAADPELLRILIDNLLDNAVKYTPEGGEVQVSITRCDDRWCLSVEDTGIGIPEAERETVFRRFYRVGNPLRPGAGLGLAIVADIVERFNGSIRLATPAGGRGLRVEVLLP